MTPTNADRQRRYRQRQRDNRLVVAVDCEFELVEVLISEGLVSASASEDKRALARAVAQALADWKYSVTRNAAKRPR
jgi:DNA-binding protein YbaB